MAPTGVNLSSALKWRMAMNYCKALFILAALMIPEVQSLIVEGELSTREDWAFIARFCYKDDLGSVKYYFEYPESLCCQKAILYYDTQWPKVYPHEDMECKDKVDVTIPKNNQILQLSANYYFSGCVKKDIGGETKIVCEGGRSFKSIRTRWWYIVLSNCGSATGVKIKYKMEMTNGNTFWTKHFSADEKNVLQPDLAFLALYMICLSMAAWIASTLRKRQLFHYTYKLYIWSVLFEGLSLVSDITYYVGYGQTGRPVRSYTVLARAFHSVSDIILLMMLILLGKGWTVTRGKISPFGQVKLGIFGTVYVIAYIALFIYEAKAFDPGRVLYIYESPAGIGLCSLRILGWMWFSYGTFFTLKHYPTKYPFYYPFWFFYSVWFLSGPVFVLIATYIIDSWQRAQVMNGIDRTVAFIAHIFFLALTRPSAANKNFPYHVRTSQVGILETKSDNSFDQHAYAPTFSPSPQALPMIERNFTDISIFSATQDQSRTKLANGGITNASFTNTNSPDTVSPNFSNFKAT